MYAQTVARRVNEPRRLGGLQGVQYFPYLIPVTIVRPVPTFWGWQTPTEQIGGADGLLDGTASLVLATDGTLTTQITMAAAAALVLATSSDLTTQITMTSSAALVLLTSSDLSTAITFDGTSTLVLATAGDLAGGAALFDASIALVLATAADLTTAITLAGTTTLVLTTAADLTGGSAPTGVLGEYIPTSRPRRR